MVNSPSDDYLRTDHLTGNLRGRSVRGGATIMVAQAAQFAINLVSTVILARLLAPGDFGLVSMVVAVTAFLMLFLDMGLGSAIVQHAALTGPQVNTLFWINAALGIGLAALTAAVAPLIARFYGEPALVGVAMALAWTFVFSGLSVQHGALLRRQMRFQAQAVIDITALAAGVATAVVAAANGAGYWALVYQQLVQQGAALVGAWIAAGWRPGLPARSAGVRPLITFGAGLTRFNILNFLSRNLDNVIIGRFAGNAALGLYLKSYTLLMLPVDRVRGPVSAVVIPALSHLQNEPIRFRRYFLKAITAIVAVGMPAVAFLFVCADDAILLALGPQWRDSILLFKILAPAAFVETFNTVGSWASLPFGESRRLVRWQTFITAVLVLAFLIGVQWGAIGVAIAFTIATVTLRIPGTVYLLKGSPVSSGEFFSALSRPAVASIAAGALVHAMRVALAASLGRLELLALSAPAFGVLYLACWRVMPQGKQTLDELFQVIHDLFPPGSQRGRQPDAKST